MDGKRFDGISRGIARRLSRRRAIGGLGMAGAAGALGIAGGTTIPVAARAAQGDDDVCVLAFQAAVRLGPSLDGNENEWAGELRFSLDEDGAVSDGSLLLDGLDEQDAFPVTGQATGSTLIFRIETLEDGAAVVAVGAGERDISRCRGTYSGLLSGPLPGDIGDWYAAPPDDEDEPTDDGGEACDPNDMHDCEIGCEEGEQLTYDCSCVTTGDAVCDRFCPEPQVLTDDCECVCLQ